MPQPRKWKAWEDAAIRRMCAGGVSWKRQGEILGLSRSTVLERGRFIGARPGKAQARIRQEEREARKMERGFDPLPAGDPRTWGLIAPGLEFPKPEITRI
jgi:hypothetical protein